MFIEEVTNIQVVDNIEHETKGYDFSTLNAISTCPFYGITRFIHNKVFDDSARNMALECGDLCHKCFAAYRALSIYYRGVNEQNETFIRGYLGRVLFTSDERFYNYYRLSPNKEAGEADRYYVLQGGLTLNTPIVIYSWGKVVDSLVNEKIVTKSEDGVYYITDMNKLINYILQGKKWSDIGIPELFGSINIASTDPVTSSPDATYYGLFLSLLCEKNINDENLKTNLPKLKEFYNKSGYMNNTPADLFERYLKTGMGGEPMIVDYEKSIIDFANANPTGFNEVKNDIRVLYPSPTIWNSHCLAIFSENGKLLYKAFEDEEIQKIAFEKYGFRTGITGGVYDVSSLGLALPKSITSTVTSLKMDTYNTLIDYLK